MRNLAAERQLLRRARNLGLAIAAAALVSACENGAARSETAAAPPAIPVNVRLAQPQRVPIVLEAVGQAEGSREVEIRSRVPGIIEKRLYDEGARVKAGQTLFVIERAPYEIALAQARAALSQERTRREQAQREAERLKPLVESRAISQREYDNAVSTLAQSTAAIEGAEAKLAEARLNLSYTEVKAPIGGVTSRALRSEGNLVAANTDLLTNITQVNPIWVRFSLAEQDFDRIRGNARGSRVNLLKRDGSIAAEGGRLNFAGSTVDPKLGTVQLRAEFTNRELEWLPGQFVKVQILAGEQEAFLVPQQAVVQTESERHVWVAQADGKAVTKTVQTANWLGSDWIVTAGLAPGDAVIVDNLMKLRPGADVTVQGGASPDTAAPVPEPGTRKADPQPAR